MEHGGEGTQGIGTGGLHLTHDVDQDGTGLTHRDIELAALIAGTQRATQLVLGSGYRQTGNLDGTIALNDNRSVGGHRLGFGLLRSTKNINNDGIARTQDIVLGGSNVHVGLETEELLIENVMTINGLATDYGGFLHGRSSRHSSSICTSLNGSTSLVIGTHTVFSTLNSGISSGGSAFLANLLVVLTAQAADLLNLDTFLHQLGDNLGLRGACLHLCLDKLDDLLVAHLG